MEKFGQILALTKRQFITVRRLSGDGLALSGIACVMPPLPLGEAFCAFLLKKLPEDTVYWTFILLYSCQNKKTQEGRGMKDIELRYVGGHVEVYTEAGAFLFSADTLREAMEELDAA